LQLKGNFLTSQGIALGVGITTLKGEKLQPPLKVVLTTLLFTLNSGLDLDGHVTPLRWKS